MISGRLLILVGAVLVLIAVERTLNAALLGFVTDNSRSVRLGVAFLCGGLAPLFFAVGFFRSAQQMREADPDAPEHRSEP
jgi:hypothetical protein